MSKAIDAQCNVEFDNEKDYSAHKKAGHVGLLEKSTPIDTPPEPTPPPGVPPEALPTPEFIEMVNRMENKNKPAVDDPSASQHPTEMPPSQPIVLTYHFTGECPDHRNPVDTFELDVDRKHFCVAVCPSDKKQLLTREVANL